MKQHNKCLLVLLALGILLSCAWAPQQLVSEKLIPSTANLASEKIRDSIVLIESANASGTGFFVAPDKIATNIHSVAHPGPVSVKSPDKEKDWAIEGVVGFDAENGLVILKLTSEETPLPLGNRFQIGEPVSIPGYRDGAFKVVEGKIQSILKNNKRLRIKVPKETDGSPVLNNNGQVIGVIVPYSSYAVPSSALATLLEQSIPIESLAAWQQRKLVRAAAYYSLGKEAVGKEAKRRSVKRFSFLPIAESRKPKAESHSYVYAYYERSRAQFYLDDPDSAIASCTRILEIDPYEADAYYGRGTVKASLGDYAAAMVDLDKAIELDTGNADAYRNRGGVKFRLGESEDASGNAEEAKKQSAKRQSVKRFSFLPTADSRQPFFR